MKVGHMHRKQTKLLMISRRLTSEHRADLHAWVLLAYFALNSARKSLFSNPTANRDSIMQSREYSCGNILQRRKK
jgi:hypothetical protein